MKPVLELMAETVKEALNVESEKPIDVYVSDVEAALVKAGAPGRLSQSEFHAAQEAQKRRKPAGKLASELATFRKSQGRQLRS